MLITPYNCRHRCSSRYCVRTFFLCMKMIFRQYQVKEKWPVEENLITYYHARDLFPSSTITSTNRAISTHLAVESNHCLRPWSDIIRVHNLARLTRDYSKRSCVHRSHVLNNTEHSCAGILHTRCLLCTTVKTETIRFHFLVAASYTSESCNGWAVPCD